MKSNDDNANGIVTISDTLQRIPINAQVAVILAEQGIIEIPNYYFQYTHQLLVLGVGSMTSLSLSSSISPMIGMALRID